ncbi:MAG: FprA family A-type flavoprotein [Eubacteriales bacterium]|nr:FprA family A-type flavoprotein [Eubacteriales bacterium]
MKDITITDSIKYVGVDDKTIDLFESQYVVPNGVSYNSYVILDEKIAVMDTVDKRGTEGWLANLEAVLDGKTPDYLVVSHLEPDHAGNVQLLAEKYPTMQIVGNPKTFPMMKQFFDFDLEGRTVTVKEGETLSLGKHTLQFFMAPMVHWPEVMVAYEQSEKILFSADGFGKFGALDVEEEWITEARRYYINIVGKYGVQVQALLKKAATLDIQMICPLHGPVLKEDLGYYIGKYLTWSSYEPEDEGIVIAYASIHGNTAFAARELAKMLEEKGAKCVKVYDLSRDDMADAIEDAYRYDTLVLAAASYDAGVFPCMEDYLNHLVSKKFQKRRVALIENGTWAPSAGKVMKAKIDVMKDIELVEPTVLIKSTLNAESRKALEELADKLVQK